MLRSCLQRVPSDDGVRNIMKSVTKLFWATVQVYMYRSTIAAGTVAPKNFVTFKNVSDIIVRLEGLPEDSFGASNDDND